MSRVREPLTQDRQVRHDGAAPPGRRPLRAVAVTITVVIVLLGLATALGATRARIAGGGPPTVDAVTTQQGGGTTGPLRVGLVTDVAGLVEGNHNALARAGLRRAAGLPGVGATQVLESATPTDHGVNLARLADDGYAPVIAVGRLMTAAVADAAARFPDRDFVLVDAVVDAPNVTSVTFRQAEGSYLAGVLAGRMTTVDTPYTDPDDAVVGFLGGRRDPATERAAAGYTAGVRSVCDRCEVLVEYVGATPDAVDDPAGGQLAALRLADAGADVVHHVAGATAAGLLAVAQDRAFFAIGSDGDGATDHPDAPVLTSTTKRIDVAVADMVEAAATGRLPAGHVSTLGIAEESIGLAPFGAFASEVPPDVVAEVERARTQVADGTVTMPR